MAGRYVLGGSSTVIENYAAQLGKRGLKVTIAALSYEYIPTNGAYEVKILPLYKISKIKKFLDNFDIIHNHHPLTNYLSLLSHKPLVYHYHGSPNFGNNYINRLNMFLSIKIMNNSFHTVIAVSKGAAKELNHYFGLKNVEIIYNGVNTEQFKPRLEECFRKGTPQFLFVGNLYDHKKVVELIIAFNEVLKIYPNANLQIIGSGNSYSKIKDLITHLNLNDKISLIGRVSKYSLPYYYSSCDVYVTSSRWELFGLPLLEAMACGKPVVATKIPSHKEIVNESKAGLLYNPGDILDFCKKMCNVFETKEEYESHALYFAKKYDWSIVVNRLIEVYNRIL